MPPNRRAVSCPDLVGLDHEDYHWLPCIPGTCKEDALRGPRDSQHNVWYWDWHADEEILRQQNLNESEHDVSFSAGHSVEQSRVDSNQQPSAAALHESMFAATFDSSHHYWAWVHWPLKHVEANMMCFSETTNDYWTDASVCEEHAVKELYATNFSRRNQFPLHEGNTAQQGADDYWHGM